MAVDSNEDIEKFVLVTKKNIGKAPKAKAMEKAVKKVVTKGSKGKSAEKEFKITKPEVAKEAKATKVKVQETNTASKKFLHSNPLKDKWFYAYGKGKDYIKPPQVGVSKILDFSKHRDKTREQVLAEQIPLLKRSKRGKKLVEMYEDTKKYFLDVENYDKCFLASLMASAHVNYSVEIAKDYFPISKMEKLYDASKKFDKDKKFGNPVLFSDNQEDMLKLFKVYDTHFDYVHNKQKLEFMLMTDERNWQNCTFKNIDFKAIEDSVNYKKMFDYINLENCTLINCKTDNLEYIKIPRDKNRFINTNELNLDNSTISKKYTDEEILGKFSFKPSVDDKNKFNLKVFDKDKSNNKTNEVSKGTGLGE